MLPTDRVFGHRASRLAKQLLAPKRDQIGSGPLHSQFVPIRRWIPDVSDPRGAGRVPGGERLALAVAHAKQAVTSLDALNRRLIRRMPFQSVVRSYAFDLTHLAPWAAAFAKPIADRSCHPSGRAHGRGPLEEGRLDCGSTVSRPVVIGPWSGPTERASFRRRAVVEGDEQGEDREDEGGEEHGRAAEVER